MKTLEEVILDKIKFYSGIKAVDLSIRVMEEVNPQKFDSYEYNKALEKLVDNNEIIELDYILPSMDYRIKSMYFMKGTELTVNGREV